MTTRGRARFRPLGDRYNFGSFSVLRHTYSLDREVEQCGGIERAMTLTVGLSIFAETPSNYFANTMHAAGTDYHS